MPIRWLHLSDCHVGSKEYGAKKLFKETADFVRRRRETTGWEPDLVFLTGDIAYSGQAEQYEQAKAELLAPLGEALGGSLGERLFMVPGNHDVDRDADFSTRAKVLEDTNVLYPNQPGQRARRKIRPRIESYAAFSCAESAVGDDWLASEAGAFVAERTIGGAKVAVIGLNTAWLSYGKDDRAQLSFGPDLLSEALDLEKVADADAVFVLGHHPLNWFRDEDARRIRAMLSKRNAIYVCGHMHKKDAVREYGNAGDFLTLQGQAVFQAHNDERWVNGFTLGGCDPAAGDLFMSPYEWSSDYQEMQPDHLYQSACVAASNWFWFPLPGRETAKKPSQVPSWLEEGHEPDSIDGDGRPDLTVPDGYKIIDTAFLDAQAGTSSRDTVLDYFNGTIPGFATALSPHVARRKVVGSIVQHLALVDTAPKPYAVLLQGAGGEGKSTVFFQVIEQLVRERGWRVLWRQAVAAGITPEQALALPREEGRPWLIAVDDADRQAETFLAAAQALYKAQRTDVHFLLAARATDWSVPFPNDTGWRAVTEFRKEVMTGLSPADAAAIVQKWRAFGDDGLGAALAGLDDSDAAKKLVNEAVREARDTRNGAFLGAMLRVRFGEGLKEYVRRLMLPLRGRPAPGGTLLDAYACIAGMHAENLLFLSKPVLAATLGCDEQTLDREVIRPLVMEAMADQGGRYVFTRHRAIAETAMAILREEQWIDDPDGIFPRLAATARRAYKNRSFAVPDIADWTFGIAKTLLPHAPALAVRVAEAVAEAQPEHLQSTVNLAKTLRKAERAGDGAAFLARRWGDFTNHKDFRGYLYEWSAAAGAAGDPALAVWLAGLSLADLPALPPPDLQQCILSLAGLGVACQAVSENTKDRDFLTARGACGQMGLLLPGDEKAKGYFQKHRTESAAAGVKDMTPGPAVAAIRKAVAKAHDLCDDPIAEELSDRLGDAWKLSYTGLTRALTGPVPPSRPRR